MVNSEARPPRRSTATILSTGVERSAPLWEMAPDAAAAAMDRHLELIDAIVRDHAGQASQRDGDVLVAFESAAAAAAAAADIQGALAAEPWPEGVAIRVRLGIHTGSERATKDTAAAAYRSAGLRDIAHGGQTLVSAATASWLTDALPEGAELVDLGVRRLRDLTRTEHVYELRHRDLRQDFPPPRSLDVLPNNLPAQLTSFVGRMEELGQIERLLAEQRLVTLAGAGGCGKTRLAAQAAAGIADRWPDGVWWVDLGPVTDPSQVAEKVAAELRILVEPAGDPLSVVASQLGSRRLLVCLDTCEHVLDVCAQLVDTVLRRCPAISVVATSREPLGVAGENVWRVPSLVEDDAVQLFAERATLVRPETGPVAGAGVEDVAEDGAAEVRTICRRLDGIPLAIELAAAWRRALTPAQIVSGLDDRFRLLTGGPRVATRRQQTLAASMEWSHDLLADVDRVVFRRLAVFVRWFTLEAAEAVCADDEVGADEILTVLGRLVDKSLVVVSEGPDAARYRMLDTVRQYADERLRAAGEGAVMRDRHLDHHLALVEAAEPELDRDQDFWRTVLESHRDNIRAALGWGLSASDPERGRRLAAAMARQWYIRGLAHEGLEFLDRAIELAPDDRSALQARLLSGAAMLGVVSGRLQMALDRSEYALAIATERDDDRTRARSLMAAAYRYFFYDFERCQELAEQAAALGESVDDPFSRDWGLVQAAYTFTTRDRHGEALALARRAAEQSLPRGDRFCGAFARGVELWDALAAGDLRRAAELGEEACRIAEPLGEYFAYGTNTTSLALVKGMLGDIDEGRRLMEPIVRSIESTPDVDVVGFTVAVGYLHLWSGDLRGAAEWLERGTRFAAPHTETWTAIRSMPGLAGALRRLGRRDEAGQWADRCTELARAIGGPMQLAFGLDEQAYLIADTDPRRTEQLHHEALAVRVEHGLRTYCVDSLDALARAAARSESFAEATRLLAASDRARAQMRYLRPPVDLPDHEALVDRLRSAVDADFDAAWAEGAELTLDDAISYATRARGSRSRPAAGWGSLTRAELEVLRLAVDGLTNPEIAARLFVSRATVKTHLSHIYAKLGVSNRTELAAAFLEHDR